jgi:NADH-quinone oxidoreductase subunit M
MMEDFGGLAKVMPIFATFLMIVTLASVAVPGTNGFVGEFMILVGTFKTYPLFGVFAVSGMIFGATYMLWMYQRVMFGPVDKDENKNIPDLNYREIAILFPIAVLIFVMGIFPGYFMRKMDASVSLFINRFNKDYEMYVQEATGKTNTNLAIKNAALILSQDRSLNQDEILKEKPL